MLKKMNYITLAALTLVSSVNAGMNNIPFIFIDPSMPNIPAPTDQELATAKMISDIMKSSKPTSLTLPADLVSVFQQLTQISLAESKLETIYLAYEEIGWFWSSRPNLTKLMPEFINSLATFDTYSKELQTEQQQFWMFMPTAKTKDQQEQAQKLSNDIISKLIYLNNELSRLQAAFLKAQPQFAQIFNQKQEAAKDLLQWIKAFIETTTGQPLTAEKQTQIHQAIKTATQPATVVTARQLNKSKTK